MTPREYMMLAEELQRDIEFRERRIAALRRMASSLGPQGFISDRVQSTPDPGRMQRFVDEIADEEQAILALRERRAGMVADIVLAISRLPDEKYCRLLELRYLEGRCWDEISHILHFSPGWTFKLHRQALDLLADQPELCAVSAGGPSASAVSAGRPSVPGRAPSASGPGFCSPASPCKPAPRTPENDSAP